MKREIKAKIVPRYICSLEDLGAKTPPIKTMHGIQEHMTGLTELEVDNVMDVTR
jgi:hypothetical protein